MLAAKAELPPIYKNRQGAKASYADLPKVLDTATPILTKHGLVLFQFPTEGGDNVSVYSLLAHKSGQWIGAALSMPVEIPRTKDGRQLMSRGQAVGTVVSYCRRYSFISIIGASTPEEDNDADTTGEQPQARQQPREQHTTRSADDCPTFRFGKHKGQPLSASESGDVDWYINAIKKNVNDPNKARWRDDNIDHYNECVTWRDNRNTAISDELYDDNGMHDDPPPHGDDDIPF